MILILVVVMLILLYLLHDTSAKINLVFWQCFFIIRIRHTGQGTSFFFFFFFFGGGGGGAMVDDECIMM